MSPRRTTPGSPDPDPSGPSDPSGSHRGDAATRMLDVAVARITTEGLSVGVDQVRMEDVIKEAGVSRATAYRRWPSREDFLADVLVEVVRRTSLVPEGHDDVERLLAIVAARPDAFATDQGRRDLVVEALRVSVDADVRRMLASPSFRTYLSVCATFPGLPAGRVRDAVGEALTRTEAEFVARRAEVYANLARLIGYRTVEDVAGPEGVHALSSAAGAQMTGVLLRALVRPAWLDERTSARLFGQSQTADWSEPERQLLAVLFAHLDPDPAATWDDAAIAGRLALLRTTFEELYALAGRPPAWEVARSAVDRLAP